MTDEEIKRKDWQILVVRILATGITQGKIILNNQQQIIAHLTGKSIEQIRESDDKNHKLNYENLFKIIQEKMPDYPEIESAYNPDIFKKDETK